LTIGSNWVQTAKNRENGAEQPIKIRMRKRHGPFQAILSQRRVRHGDFAMPKVSLVVNGKRMSAEVDSRTLLAQFLRDNLRLTGTHVGCDTSQCGSCVVHVNGKAIKSCTALAVAYDGAEVTTIEGLANGQDLHPMQAAFRTHHGLQCGFCTPGMIMSAIDMVNRLGTDLSEETIRHELEGNICRCTGYHNIVKAIQAGAAAMGGMKLAAE
jgi:aerobic carbon-monoxide dehydrogenase small subunit